MRRIPLRVFGVLVLIGMMLCGCSRPNLEPVGAISMAQFAKDEMDEAFFNGGYTFFETHDEHAGTLQNDRIPDWAKEDYSACVYWEDAFTSSHRSLPGQNVRGNAWGWILVNKDLETFVMELSYQRDDSEEVVTLIDQWDGPAED